MAEPLASLGRYRILAELGRGIMGIVYRAHDPDLGRDVALKVIRSDVEAADGDPKKYERRFFNEARAAARLSHPAIVIVHDVGRDAASGSLFMALELLQGSTLQAVMRERGPLPWPEALRLVARVAEGLHHAHERGIVHRDVKPANIMVLDSGDPKIMDFGIAKVEASQITAAGQVFGTPLYMSPEQAQARPVDPRSDLFSLGAVLYEMLTGRKAFAGDTIHKVVLQVVHSDPPPASAAVTGLPEDVDHALARCLAKDPARRYPSGQALAEDLTDILAGAPPRGRATWLPPRDPGATLVSSRSPLPRERDSVGPGTGAPPGRRPFAGIRSPRTALLLAAAFVAAAAGAAYLAAGRLAPLGAPSGAPSAAKPSQSVSPAPEATATSPAPAEPSASPQAGGAVGLALDRVTSLLTGPKPARLVVDFEHTLRSGTLRVWVDEATVIEEGLDSRVTRRIAGIDLRKGRRQDSVDVSPGRHEIRVRVTWDDNVKTESIWANFKPGTERRLQARLRGVGSLRDLALHWH
jgi:hypothetical protein